MSEMTSNQPYLLRAFYDWIVDNDLTPYIVVDANVNGVDVPREFVQNGQIVLNISPGACVNLNMDLEWVSFQARFSGTPRLLSIPCEAIAAIYARENGAGTVFVNENETGPSEEEMVEDSTEEQPSVENEQPKAPRPSGKPSLKVVK
jgi:stringent starvation protein B